MHFVGQRNEGSPAVGIQRRSLDISSSERLADALDNSASPASGKFQNRQVIKSGFGTFYLKARINYLLKSCTFCRTHPPVVVLLTDHREQLENPPACDGDLHHRLSVRLNQLQRDMVHLMRPTLDHDQHQQKWEKNCECEKYSTLVYLSSSSKYIC